MLLERTDPDFKLHLDVCNQSASLMCCLHEALFRDFGLHGLQFMQGGIDFTVYSVLACIMVHMVSSVPCFVTRRNVSDNILGCNHIDRPSHQLTCSKVFHATHAYTRALHTICQPRAAGAAQCPP